jgi:hypothetical protein
MVLGQAVEKYQEAQTEAFTLLYREQEKTSSGAITHEACFQEIAAICAHFSHSLLKVSEQLRQLLLILGDLDAATHGEPKKRSWDWIQIWRRRHGRSYSSDHPNAGECHKPGFLQYIHLLIEARVLVGIFSHGRGSDTYNGDS